MIKLEAGKTYLDRKGNKHGPLVHNLNKVDTRREYSLEGCGLDCAWRADGRFYNSGESPLDLIVEAKTTMRNSSHAGYNDGTIHGWNGGDCPVHPETVVKVYFEDQLPMKGAACEFRWTLDTTGLDVDIVAFRVVKQPVEPKVIWVNEYEDGYHTAHDTEEKAKQSARFLPSRLIRIAVKYVEAVADARVA